jgi:DNA-binding beta-propeller fold protein YncE
MRHLLMGAVTLGLCAFAPAARGTGGYHVETKIALPDGGWDLASFDPVMRRVYLARTDSVTAIDVDTGTVSRLAAASRSHAVVPVNHGAEVMVTDGGTNTARFIDAKTGADIASVKVGTAPDAALFDEHSGLALVMNAKSGDVSLIDPKTHSLVGSIMVGGSLELAVSDGKGRVFLNVEDKNELVVLDLKARTARHIALKGCDGPTGIAYLALSHRVLSACGNGVAALTNALTLKVERTLPIGKGPDTALYDPLRHRALVPCGRSGDVWIFADTAKGVVARGKAATQQGARTGALDPKTGKAYLPAAEYDPPVAPSTRPKMRPGTAVLVVVTP